MTGWLKRDNGSTVEESFGSPRKTQKPEVFPVFESGESSDKEVRTLFNEFVAAFLKELLGHRWFRPLPPVIGLNQEVDLFELHIAVRKRGGYNSVSRNGFWSLVATDCGFDSGFGSALKLVYVKYLDTLARWLSKILKDKTVDIGVKEEYHVFSGPFMELGSDLKRFLSDKEEEDFVGIINSALGSDHEDLDFLDLKVDVNSVHEKWSNENTGGHAKVEENQYVDKCVNGEEWKLDGASVSRKRKRKCYSGMLKWISMVAKDPCDCAIDPLPERHKWNCYGTEMEWKKILLAREAMLLKKNVDGSSQQFVWQKKQKMHPSMYDDNQSGSERLRCSKRLIFAKDSSQKTHEVLLSESSSSGFQNDEDITDKASDSPNFCGNQRRQKRIPIGPSFQADLPEFCKEDYKIDSRWLGTKIWPLEKGEPKKSLIERDPIGKGKRETCGCQFPSSLECVTFHVSEKKVKLKLELGSAYGKWKFDGMGEIVAHSWNNEDEKKFQGIVDSNRLSSEKYFWNELFKHFPEKGREALVSYYFNVFLLRRRGCQNRNCNSNIDSDDEESEFGPVGNRFGQIGAKSPGSIFCSPKKNTG
ncbi:hypothetical protein OROGR_031918 [Orobanche gracilis]